MPCGCVTSPQIKRPIQPTQNAWGAWASTATTASMSTTGGAAAACVIGPKGPMVVGPEGPTGRQAGLKAVKPMAQPEGSTAYCACQRRVVCTNMASAILPVLKVPPNKRVRQIEHRIWPVTDSYLRIQTAWLSSRRLDYMSGLGPTATSGHLHQRRHRR